MSAAVPEAKANMGRPDARIDGRAKVTGEARYPSDVSLADAAYAYLVTSAIARGRIKSFGLERARAVPGVLDVLTYENVGESVRPVQFFSQGGHVGSSIRPLSSARVHHDGQIVAIVLADTFEAAREAAYVVGVEYEEETPSASFDSPGVERAPAKKGQDNHQDPHVGDAEAALAGADIVVDERYSTSTMHHNALELFTTTCAWSGEHLTIYEPSQFVYGLRFGVAEQLGVDPDKVRVRSKYVGGAFGSKGAATQRTALIALAARRLDRPVKLVATRGQGYTIATYRAETRHHVRLGSTRAGKLVAYGHEGSEISSRPDPYKVGGTQDTCRMYAFGSVWTKVNIIHADRNTPGFMRSPPETPYMYALESAMDEMAVKLKMDPIAFRRLNDTMKDSVTGKIYSSRSLMRCYDEAANAFGWSKRPLEPRSMRQGDWMIGWGCATAVYPAHVGPAAARVRLSRDGAILVQTAAHEIGTGAYTVIGQAAAERLGAPLDKVQVELGDSDLPPAPVAGGSNTTASVTSAVTKACDAIRDKLFRAAVTANDGALAGRSLDELTISEGSIRDAKGASETIEQVFERLHAGVIEEYAETTPKAVPPGSLNKLYAGKPALGGGSHGDKMMFAFGAELVEVRVHARTGEIRVARMVGAFAGGRIANPRTARSQLMGGMIWGLSHALHEKTEIDERAARYVNRDLADYLIPVNADVREMEIILVPEVDGEVNAAGMKGLGELGNVGTAAAIAGAVHHATGVRVRHTPIRIEDVLGAL